MWLPFILITSALGTILPPQWNDFWAMNFSEHNALGDGIDQGIYYYGWNVSERAVIYRNNGRDVGICGKSGIAQGMITPCTTYWDGNTIYSYFSALGVCCVCCANKASSCNTKPPTYYGSGTFVDIEVVNGIEGYRWTQLQTKWNYYETINNTPLLRVPLNIVDPDGTYMMMIQNTYTFKYDASVLTPPAICETGSACTNLVCQAFKSAGAREEEQGKVEL